VQEAIAIVGVKVCGSHAAGAKRIARGVPDYSRRVPQALRQRSDRANGL